MMKQSILVSIIGILFLGQFGASTVQAQTAQTMQQRLMSKTWKESGRDGLEMHLVFTRDSVKYYFVGNPAYAGFDAQFAYYLSDEMDRMFDPNKVGKAENGIYIIEEMLAKPAVFIRKIINIDKDALKCEEFVDNRAKRIIAYPSVN